MEERRAEGVRGSVQGLRQYRHPGRVAFVPWGRGRCNPGRGCPEYVVVKLRTEPRRLFHHLGFSYTIQRIGRDVVVSDTTDMVFGMHGVFGDWVGLDTG